MIEKKLKILLNNNQTKEIIFEIDENGYTRFQSVAIKILNKQNQYASRYVDGAFGEYPNLGEGLRIKGKSDDYHEMKIHIDDIEEFCRRYFDYLKNN